MTTKLQEVTRDLPERLIQTMNYDEHFRLDNFKRYGLQCGLAGLAVLILLSVIKQIVLPMLMDLV